MPTQLVTSDQLQDFLTRLGQACSHPAQLYLFGGSALLLMGGQRRTADVDFTVGKLHSDELRQAMERVAGEMEFDVEESVPDEFMPLPSGVAARHQLIGRFGNLEAYVFDP